MTLQEALMMAGHTTWASHGRDEVDAAVSVLAAEVRRLQDEVERIKAEWDSSASRESSTFAELLERRAEVRRLTGLVDSYCALEVGEREVSRLKSENATMLAARVGFHCQLSEALGIQKGEQVDTAMAQALSRVAELRADLAAALEREEQAGELINQAERIIRTGNAKHDRSIGMCAGCAWLDAVSRWRASRSHHPQ